MAVHMGASSLVPRLVSQIGWLTVDVHQVHQFSVSVERGLQRKSVRWGRRAGTAAAARGSWRSA